MKETQELKQEVKEVEAFVNAVDMLDKMRDNNMTTVDSVCELIDNSFDAGARNVWIEFDIDKNTKQMWFMVQDDGKGVDRLNIKRALSLAGTMNPRYSEKIGRFGMGLSNACASQSPKSIFASKTKEDPKIWTNEIDFEYLKQHEVIFPKTYELNNEFMLSRRKFKDSGSMVLWTNCDNLDKKKTGTLQSHLMEHISRLYRYFMNLGRNIYINNNKVEIFDPLCKLENHRFAKDYGISNIYGDPIVIPIKYVDKEDGKEKKSNVVIELVMLDYDKINDNEEFNPRAGGKNKLKIGMKMQGLYLVRNNREIDVPSWFGVEKQKEDWKNYIRGEIRFESELDWNFGIGHNKNRAYPKDIVLDRMKEELRPIIKTALSEHKRRVNQRKEAMKNKGSKIAKDIYDQSSSSTIPDEKLEETEVKKDKPKQKNKKEFEEEAEKKIDNDPTINEKTKEFRKERLKEILAGDHSGGIIISSDGAASPIFRVEIVDGKRIIMLNGDHKFYEHVYEPALDNAYSNALIDLAIYSLADVRGGLGTENFIRIFDEILIRFSRRYGAMFNQKDFAELLAMVQEGGEQNEL